MHVSAQLPGSRARLPELQDWRYSDIFGWVRRNLEPGRNVTSMIQVPFEIDKIFKASSG